jgi:hypothetical protein
VRSAGILFGLKTELLLKIKSLCLVLLFGAILQEGDRSFVIEGGEYRLKRFTSAVGLGIFISIIIIIIGTSIFYFKTEPEISYNKATASAEKQLRLIVGSKGYSVYKKNWVVQTYLKWYTEGRLLSTKRIYVVNVNLTLNSNDPLPSRDFEFLVNAKNGNTFSALEYTVSENHMYKPPF